MILLAVEATGILVEIMAFTMMGIIVNAGSTLRYDFVFYLSMEIHRPQFVLYNLFYFERDRKVGMLDIQSVNNTLQISMIHGGVERFTTSEDLSFSFL
jgi:hypothetical protein